MSSLDTLARLLKGAPFDLTAEEIADAIWLATVTGPLEAREVSSPSTDADTTAPDEPSMPDARPEEPTGSQPVAPAPARTPEKGADVVLPRERALDASFPFRSPTAAAIADPLALGRALRPLRRRVPSAARSVLDEGATATFVADTFGLWLPVMKPAMSRWLDLELVVEDSPSMRLWSRTTAELEPLLQFNGAFRSVTAWRLGTDGALGLFSGRDRSGAAPRAHRELLDAQGRRAILIVSDCVSSAWSDGTLGEWLESWTAGGPVAVLQVLPPHLWGRTALRRGLRATFSAATPALPNTRLSTHYITPPPKADQDLLALPIATLEPDSLGAWARLVAGLSGESLGVALPGVGPEVVGGGEEARPAAVAPPTPEARVRRFRATSSEAARRLASCLAVVPITLPIVRLVRASLVPEARDGDIAEVFLGGLLREISFDEDPDRTEYDFHDGVRALLLDYLPGRDALQVIARVSRYIEPRLGETQDFLAGLTAVSGDDGSSFARRQRRFATLAVHALERLGDDYRENVAALHGDIAAPGPGSDPGPAAPGTSTRFLEVKAAEYERMRKRLRAGPDRTSNLDSLIEDVIRHVKRKAVSADLVRALYETGRDGARVIALGCCVGAPEVELVETITDALRAPRTPFELWWALRAARAIIESSSPLRSEPCAAAVLEQFDGATSLLNAQPDGASNDLASSVLDVFARQLGLPDTYSLRAVRAWIKAGSGRKDSGRWVAILGSDPRGENFEFCRALGARLATHGWKVVGSREGVGDEVITSFLNAGGAHSDALLYSFHSFGGIVSMRRSMIARADGAFVIAGADDTATERDMARAERVPIVAIGFTGGVAAQTASEMQGDLAARETSADLYRILEARRSVDLSAEAAVRLLDLAVRQRVSEDMGRFELYDDAGLRQWLVSVGRYRGDEILEMANIFVSWRQRTWLVSLPGHVLCVLDDTDTRRQGRLVQFAEPPERLLPVSTAPRSSNTGFLHMGSRREWLYSFKLFPDPADLVSRVERLIERSRLADDTAASSRSTPHRATILFVVGNLQTMPWLALDEELHSIEAELRWASGRNAFELRAVSAGRADDLRQHLLNARPTILHFSGHASAEGIFLEDSRGEPYPISPAELGSMITSVGTVRLVVLNASYGDLLAAALRDTADCTIGVKGAIADRSAIAFSVGFYRALVHGRSVGDAFRQGAASLAAMEPDAAAQPRSFVRKGINIDTLMLGAMPESAGPLAQPGDDLDPAAVQTDPRPVPAFDPHVIRLGVADDRRADPIVIPLEDIKTHVAFLGSTGSGKTTAALSVIEQLLERGISVLLVDRKGDLSRYASETWWTDPRTPLPERERKASLRAKIEIGLYTPGNPQGRPLRLPLVPALDDATPHDQERLARFVAGGLSTMMGYGNAAAHRAKAVILECAIRLHASEHDVTFDVLLDRIIHPDAELLHTVGPLQRHFAALAEDLQTLSIQRGSLISGHDDELNVAELLPPPGAGRARLSIINTTALTEVPVLQFWILRLLVELGRFGRKRPSPTLQAAAFFDEADTYIPATSSPPTKEPLFDLLRRSRSTGIGILLATQNPGDFDYKIRDNIYTWLLGKVTQSRTIDKMRNLIANYPDITPRLASQRTGSFFLLSGSTKREFKADRPLMDAMQLSESEITELARTTRPQRHSPRE